MKIGVNLINGGLEFVVWAPFLKKLELKIVSPKEKIITMEVDENGYWRTFIDHANSEIRYFYKLKDKGERPDPASHFQPEGVHGCSQVLNHNSFAWEDENWRGASLSEMIMYELHVGTFTSAGTFDAAIQRLNDLKDTGINAIEIMPVAQYPGERNWGYDGVYPFAVQNSYGGPDGLKRLVNECHKNGLSVILDVVYNHLGPEGSYFSEYGPYFTDKYKTPWGQAINFDDAYSNEVRNFFIENALYWFKNYHIDCLRLDAVHNITDMSAKPFLQELAERVEEFSITEGRKFYLIAESDLNDSRITRPKEFGGYGIDGQWCDDFHHCLHALLTEECEGYYVDFGKVEQLVKSIKEGFVYSGIYSKYRKRNHGNSSENTSAKQFVVCSQNHDQAGNRISGERLSTLISFEALKLAAGVVLLSPYIPLLFMGEEYGEDAPFLYFISHSDPDLVKAVRGGRKNEFNAFSWEVEPPDPQGVETFLKSKINWGKREIGDHRVLLDFYKRLIKLRKETPALSNLDKCSLDVCGFEKDKILSVRRWKDNSHAFYVFNFNKEEMKHKISLPEGRWPEGKWKKVLDSSDSAYNGQGASAHNVINITEEITLRGQSIVLYIKEGTK